MADLVRDERRGEEVEVEEEPEGDEGAAGLEELRLSGHEWVSLVWWEEGKNGGREVLGGRETA